jgi:hypothetical protein
MKKKHFIFFTAVFLTGALLTAQEQASQTQLLPDTTTLLLSYVENDAELKNLTISAKKAQLSYKSTMIDTGFDVTLSSGTVTLQLNDDGSKLSAKPSVKAKLPAASNLSASAQTNLSRTDDDSKISDTSISIGVDIISSALLTNKITRLKAERSVAEAQRKIEKRAIAAEKEFYTELKKLLSSISSIISKQEKFYSDQIDFEAKKIQGYSQNSSTYRQAELKVKSDERDIQTAIHTLVYDTVVFYKKCGYDIQIDENVDLMSLVPSDIEALEPVDVTSLNKELYSEIESANWTYTINSLERKAKKTYSLSASGGYTFENSSTKSDTIDAGLTGTIGGLTLGAGVSFPVNEKQEESSKSSTGSTSSSSKSSLSPTYTFTATLSPNTFRKNSITKEQNALTEEQELLSIASAEANYQTKVVELQQKLDNLLWEKESAEKNLTMYEDLERDMANLYKQGYVSENDYLSSKNNLNSNIIKKISNLIDLIIYNDDVISNFVREEFQVN